MDVVPKGQLRRLPGQIPPVTNCDQVITHRPDFAAFEHPSLVPASWTLCAGELRDLLPDGHMGPWQAPARGGRETTAKGDWMRLKGILAGLAGLAALAGVAPAYAQDVDRIDRITGTTRPGGNFRPPEDVKVVVPGALVFASFDANHDGIISNDEIAAGAERAFSIADRNGDGVITGFEQSDWANAMGDPTGVLANAMTFDINLDRSVQPSEFAAGLQRIAGQIAQEDGALKYTDLVQPLNRSSEQAGQDSGGGWGRITPRSSPPRDRGG